MHLFEVKYILKTERTPVVKQSKEKNLLIRVIP